MPEKVTQTKQCRQCKTMFDITDKDLEFYDKISPTFSGKKYAIPSPEFCPECRQQRRLMFRNTRKLYRRKCDATGKDIIAIHDASSPYKVYDDAIRRSDQWDPLEYGRIFDEKMPFFEQFYQLSKDVPDSAIWSTNCVNCDYCHISMSSKNCYLLS